MSSDQEDCRELSAKHLEAAKMIFAKAVIKEELGLKNNEDDVVIDEIVAKAAKEDAAEVADSHPYVPEQI